MASSGAVLLILLLTALSGKHEVGEPKSEAPEDYRISLSACLPRRFGTLWSKWLEFNDLRWWGRRFVDSFVRPTSVYPGRFL
jgi:hypothetical protein